MDNTTNNNEMLFGKMNYIIMAVGFAMIMIGFALMSGGRSADPSVFNAEEVYSFTRITLAPLVVLAGFVVEIVAILYKGK